MILILLSIIMILLSLILMKDNMNENIRITGGAINILSFIFLITSLVIIIGAHTTANNSIQRNKIEYEGLCKRYEIIKSDYEDVSKSDVISDITEWNMEVYNTKYWSESLWTNWFNPKKIADNLYYIPLDAESEK